MINQTNVDNGVFLILVTRLFTLSVNLTTVHSVHFFHHQKHKASLTTVSHLKALKN